MNRNPILNVTDSSKLDSNINFTSHPNVDTNDDYYSELNKVRKIQGHQYQFTFEDYICKILLGSISSYFDSLDEIKSGSADKHINKDINKKINNNCTCVIL